MSISLLALTALLVQWLVSNEMPSEHPLMSAAVAPHPMEVAWASVRLHKPVANVASPSFCGTGSTETSQPLGRQHPPSWRYPDFT